MLAVLPEKENAVQLANLGKIGPLTQTQGMVPGLIVQALRLILTDTAGIELTITHMPCCKHFIAA